MIVCVYGLYHLGSVTAACVAEAGFTVVGVDEDTSVIEEVSNGKLPLFERGLAELISEGIQRQKLSFSSDLKAVEKANVVWVTYDTPVDDDDCADTDYVMSRIMRLYPYLKEGCVVLVSSQLPVGSLDALEKDYSAHYPQKPIHFACSPENLRLGSAIAAFKTQARIVVGCSVEAKSILEPLFAPFCSTIHWMSHTSAEMTKHAVNSYLAMCVAWTNELATLCEQTGADARQVEKALRDEPRIGPKAYVRAGASFGGGTLARDVRFLEALNPTLPLLASILPSNEKHADWPVNYLQRHLGDLAGKMIAVLGLAYKPDTSSMRRSMSIRWCEKLLMLGAKIQAYDPQIDSWPDVPKGMVLCADALDALHRADALIIGTEWDIFKTLNAADVKTQMLRPLVLDQGRFLEEVFAQDASVHYVTVGRLV